MPSQPRAAAARRREFREAGRRVNFHHAVGCLPYPAVDLEILACGRGRQPDGARVGQADRNIDPGTRAALVKVTCVHSTQDRRPRRPHGVEARTARRRTRTA